MHAKDWALNAVLQERQQWVIPVYQRTYEWKTGADGQLPKLWDDLRERALEQLDGLKPKPHFVGAIIYAEPAEQPFGTVNKRYLVDGQQRITTFNLVLCALRENARDCGIERITATVDEYLFNAKSASMADPERERFKLWSSSFDRPLFTAIAALSADDVRGKFNQYFYKNGNIIRGIAPKVLAAYWYLKEEIATFISERAADGIPAERVIDAIIAGFLNGFQIVVVQLGKEDDAQAIFASLNGNAQPLSAFDLIRNDIFHRASKALEDNDILYDQHWRELETEFWKTEVKQGRLKRPRTDHLITHALVAETAHDVIVGQVANEYRHYAEAQDFASVTDEVRSLMKYGRAYEEMELRKKGGALAELARFLAIWDTAAMHPIALWIAVRDLPDERKKAVYALIESYMIRRDLCELGNKNYNKVVAGALREMQAVRDPVDAFFTYMVSLTGDASRLPTDAELLRSAPSKAIYNSMGSQKLRYVLSGVEWALRDKFDEDVTVSTANLTVEHIMPRHWAKNWPLPSGKVAPTEDAYALLLTNEDMWSEVEQREAIKDTLGNLTLLTTSLNPSLGNAGWDEKRTAISKSLLVLNRDVAEHVVWDEVAIRERASTLANVITSIWKYPVVEVMHAMPA